MLRLVGVLTLGVIFSFALARQAQACGGCIAPPGPFSAVESHRMVIKIGPDETILWDQFVYSGAPEEFAWILPVPDPHVSVELADEDFVTILDQETAPRVTPGDGPCSAGGGCGGGDSVLANAARVKVYDGAVVGPYETATIGAEDGTAIFSWMQVNGYALADNAESVLQRYAEEGYAFVVLRLRPGEGVAAMKPVRVRFRGFMGLFPLRMVALGAAGAMDLSLWVIADERYAIRNYPTVTIDPNSVQWDWRTLDSNYDELFAQAVAENQGRAWVTEFAATLGSTGLEPLLQERAGDDFVVAFSRIPYPVITRLRTRIESASIGEDLELVPSADAAMVPREFVANSSVGGECEADAQSAPAGPAGLFAPLLLTMGAWFAQGTWRRTAQRRRRTRSSLRLPPA